MAFPQEYTVNRNVRELWAEVRRLSRAKQLGHSSLGPTDGAMEVRDASGNPVAKVGHEGSTGGLLIPGPGGTWVSLADERDRIDAEAATTNVRIDNVWLGFDSHGTRIDALEGESGTAASRIAALETENTLLQGWLSNFAAYVSVLNTRINALDGGSNPGPPLPGGGA